MKTPNTPSTASPTNASALPGQEPSAEARRSVVEPTSDTSQPKLLRQVLYVAISTPVREVDADFTRVLIDQLPDHWSWLQDLERRGSLFAAGPFIDPTTKAYAGDGLLIFRASCLSDAVALAEADPINRAGLRTAQVRPWELNEGGFTLAVSYSDSMFEIR